MRYLTLTAVALLIFATPAASEISAGPPGLINVVDTNGKILGGLIDIEAAGDKKWTVSLDTSEGAGFVYLEGDHTSFDNFDALYFTTSDCTGQPYANGWSPGLNGGLGLVVSHNRDLYAVTGNPTNQHIRSSLSGNCSLSNANWSVAPITEVGNLIEEFTPPFSFQTVMGVKQATVPLHIGWLLGGILLGLGIKAAVKKR